ncbi:benzodiazapine receptor [Arthrobacter sp. MP_M7]|nr:benzodiazapine receptor [Arthrobacter sp. MP_M4]MEC5204894.1 benzodiazapine receptor [Arthrobacter sp. MP_M7]
MSFDPRAPIGHRGSVPANPNNSLLRPTLAEGGPRGRQRVALLGFLAASWCVSALGSLPIRMAGDGWYAAAEKAPWTPPGWMFGSAWLVLYAAMAVAVWLVWRQQDVARRPALRIYAALLLLCLLWPLMFFGLYPVLGTAALWLALLVIGAHAAAAAAAVLHFGPISRVAGLLMLPYLSWLVFSASLNMYAAIQN